VDPVAVTNLLQCVNKFLSEKEIEGDDAMHRTYAAGDSVISAGSQGSLVVAFAAWLNP